MKEINIAVVDDNNFDSRKLANAVKEFFSDFSGQVQNLNPDLLNKNLNFEIEIFSDGKEILERFEPGKFQIIFMDIIMKFQTGIETAQKLREIDREVFIIFVTSSRDFAFEAFPIHSFDYILKPFNQERINYVLSEALKILSDREPYIDVRVARSSYKIPLKNISAVRSSDHSVELVMINGQSMLCSMTFKEFQKLLLNDPRFLECNRGLIINMDCVMSPDSKKEVFVMKNGERYAVQVRHRKNVLDAFTQYQILKLRRVANEIRD